MARQPSHCVDRPPRRCHLPMFTLTTIRQLSSVSSLARHDAAKQHKLSNRPFDECRSPSTVQDTLLHDEHSSSHFSSAFRWYDSCHAEFFVGSGKHTRVPSRYCGRWQVMGPLVHTTRRRLRSEEATCPPAGRPRRPSLFVRPQPRLRA